MQIGKLILAALVLLAVSQIVVGQSNSSLTPDQKSKLLEVPKTSYRPKLSLQDALKVAEGFITAEQIDTTHFYLYRASFILYGEPYKPDRDKIPGWHFWWASDSGEQGNNIYIFVSMDRKCMRLMSM